MSLAVMKAVSDLERVRDGVKKIKVVHSAKNEMTLVNKTLTLKADWAKSYFGSLEIKSFLMEKL